MITLIVGGQYGGEGKGKISAFLSTQHNYSAICRTGSVNSKHTVVTKERAYDLRQLPTPCAHNFTGKILFGAGSLIHIATLKEEMKLLGLPQSNVTIDRQAGILTDECIQAQRADDRYKNIGSTLTGTGYATAQRALRKLPLAKDRKEVQSMLGDTSERIWECLDQGKEVLVEGHQSTGLSNLHGDYPFVSNRDGIAAELLSELGVGPRHNIRIILVIKAFPTRNHNGYLPNEMTEGEARTLGIQEYGGGSWGIVDNKRRVGRIDLDELVRVVHLNTPTEIALTGLDYVDPTVKGIIQEGSLTKKTTDFINEVEEKVKLPVTIISTGPETSSTIYRPQGI